MSREKSVDSFPLFLLGTVLLPTEVTKLHVFEDRYKEMIGRCLEDNSEFGIVFSDDVGSREIGCAARVTDVLENFDDGRMNISVLGTEPIRIIAQTDELVYPAARIEYIIDEPPVDVSKALVDQARNSFATLVEQATDERPEDENIAGMNAYDMAAKVELGVNAKQRLLESRVETDRLELVTKLFDTGAEMIAKAKEIGKRAQSNGKVQFDDELDIDVEIDVDEP